MDRKRILWISDGVVPTGFGRVAHSIIKNLDSDIYQVLHLAINYWGDPHPHNHMIYPAPIRGNIYGMDRIKEFLIEFLDMLKKHFTLI